jgi:transglutaminase-like putative cysteine protease
MPGGAPGETTIAARMQFDDPWSAARFLAEEAEEDAGDPVVRAWALALLDATASATGEEVGPTVSPDLINDYARTVHGNVQSQIRFVREPRETFQAARVTMSAKAGDCDDHARLVHALLRAGGVRSRLYFFERDDQPVHVVAQALTPDADGASWKWLETTIPAGFNEHPKRALARVASSLPGGGSPFEAPIGRLGGPARARRGSALSRAIAACER